MKPKPQSKQGSKKHSELLILADGRILAHSLTPVLARVLAELTPGDNPMRRRANVKEANKT